MYIINSFAAALAAPDHWSEYGALAAWLSVIVAVVVAFYALKRDRAREAAARAADMERERGQQKEREETEASRLEGIIEALVLAVLGRPASADGTFPHIPGIVDQVNSLVNDFSKHSGEVREYQERTDLAITALRTVLEEVAKEYKTNGGSTVKDDLLGIIARLRKLEAGQAVLRTGQTDAAAVAEGAAVIATERDDIAVESAHNA